MCNQLTISNFVIFVPFVVETSSGSWDLGVGG